MDSEREKILLARLEEQEEKIDKIYESVEKTRKMILWSGIATLVTFVLPFIILLFMLPKAMDLFAGGTQMLDQASTMLDSQNADTTESLSELLKSLES